MSDDDLTSARAFSKWVVSHYAPGVPMRTSSLLLRITLFLPAVALTTTATAQQRARFEIVVPSELRNGPLTGRAFVMISRTNDREPRFQIGRTGVPFYGHDFE